MIDDIVTCDLCRRQRRIGWTLTGYYGITGRVCRQCFEAVEHDGWGKPRHHMRYKAALKRFLSRIAVDCPKPA